MKHNHRIRGTIPEIEQAARKLRNNLTLAESRLWSALRNKQLEGYGKSPRIGGFRGQDP